MILLQKLSQLRLACQSLFMIFCLYSGWKFYLFYLWTLDSNRAFTPRPPAVEAFLPIGALVSLKRYVLGAGYDPIHPAGLTIFIAALLIAFFARKGFCGWICPVGFASNLVEKIRNKMHLSLTLPVWIDMPLLSLKYLLLGFFSYLILFKMEMPALTAFHNSAYNLIADAKMLHFFLQPTVVAGSIMLFIVFVSFVLKNFWCRYLCPYGGLLGLLALLSPLQIQRNPDICIDCKKCERACPASIRITRRNTIRNAECIGCLECLPVCPARNCLTLSGPGEKQINPILLPILTLGLFFLCYFLALTTNHWHTEIPVTVLQQYYQQLESIGHP